MASYSLPQQATPLIGRVRELADLQALLADPGCRLITIMGPGGIGKTHLALEAVHQWIERQSSDRQDAVFVPLQPLRSSDLLVPAIASAVQFQFYAEVDPKQQLLDFLRNKRQLLLLDNFEHLIDGAMVVNDLLTETAVSVLVTSRERLGLTAETVYTLDGLDLPAHDSLESDALRLFLEAARRVHSGWNPAPADLRHIAALCHLLGGMPLAILMSAAWVSLLAPEEIAAEIQGNLDFLQTNMRDVPDRQRSMRAVFDTSWDRLTDRERDAFAALSIFQGGFTRDAAHYVAEASLPVLSSLVDKSLLRVDSAASGRYMLHELLRQYAEERLYADPERHQRVARRHRDFYCDLLARLEPDLKNFRQLAAFRTMDREIDNLRLAWRQAVLDRDDAALEKCLFAFQSYYRKGRFREGYDIFKDAADRLRGTGSRLFWQMLIFQDAFYNTAGIYEDSVRPIEELMQNRDRIPVSEKPTFYTMGQAWHLHSDRGYDAYRELLQDNLRYFERQNDLWNMAWAYHNLGAVALEFRRFDEALAAYRKGVDLFEQVGDARTSTYGIGGLASALEFLGDDDQARPLYEKHFRINALVDDASGCAWAAARLFVLALRRDDRPEALHQLARIMPLLHRIPLEWHVLALHMAAQLWVERNPEWAAGWTAAARAQTPARLRAKLVTDHSLRGLVDPAIMTQLEAALSHEAFQAALELGQAMTRDAALEQVTTALHVALHAHSSPFKPAPAAPGLPVVTGEHTPLTEREQEVLTLVAQGLSNREIAERLVVTVGTVKKHLNNVFSKLGVEHRTAAIVRARELSLIR